MSRRRFAIAALLALSASLSGCWVIEEIDKGQKWMDDHSDKSKKKPEEAAPATAVAKPGALDAYFRQQDEEGTTKSFTPGQMSEGIVACKLGRSTQFMKKEDCAARGGRSS
jgi:hypothetical protein